MIQLTITPENSIYIVAILVCAAILIFFIIFIFQVIKTEKTRKQRINNIEIDDDVYVLNQRAFNGKILSIDGEIIEIITKIDKRFVYPKKK